MIAEQFTRSTGACSADSERRSGRASCSSAHAGVRERSRMTPERLLWGGCEAAVDADRGPGDRASTGACEEGDEVADVLGCRKPADRNVRGRLVYDRLRILSRALRQDRRDTFGAEPHLGRDGTRGAAP